MLKTILSLFVAVLPQFEGFNCIAKILHCKIELGVSIAINKKTRKLVVLEKLKYSLL